MIPQQNASTRGLKLHADSGIPAEFPMLVEAILFDLDGTLIDSMGLIVTSVNEALKRNNFQPMNPKDFQELSGRPLSDFLRTQTTNVTSAMIEAVKQDFLEIYGYFSNGRTILFPGAKRTLRILSSRGFPLGIVTTTPRKLVERDLVRLGLNRCISVTVTGEDTVKQKPAPDGLLRAAKTLKVSGNKTVYVGDSPPDIQAGKAAKMKTIAVTTGICPRTRLMKEKPDALIPNVTYLPFLLGNSSIFPGTIPSSRGR